MISTQSLMSKVHYLSISLSLHVVKLHNLEKIVEGTAFYGSFVRIITCAVNKGMEPSN